MSTVPESDSARTDSARSGAARSDSVGSSSAEPAARPDVPRSDVPPLPPPPGADDPATDRARPPGDVVAGGLFVLIGAAFAVPSLEYGLGSWREMGPGMFPFVLGLGVAGLGMAVLVTGLRGGDGSPGLTRLPWRALLCVVASLVFFAFTVSDLGLIPATAGAALLGCLAAPTSIVRAAATTVGITLGCYLVFVVALQLRLPLFP